MPKGSSYNAKGLLSRPFRKAAAEGETAEGRPRGLDDTATDHPRNH